MNRLLVSLDEQFARLHQRSSALLSLIPAEQLYRSPRAPSSLPSHSASASALYSCGEHLLRSAALVEQTFGGITSNLWDDPFEWTLPESLTTPELVQEYLQEVEATRCRGFECFVSDDDLRKEIMAPSGEQVALFSLLLDTLARASHHQGRAFAVFSLFNDARPPHL